MGVGVDRSAASTVALRWALHVIETDLASYRAAGTGPPAPARLDVAEDADPPCPVVIVRATPEP
jgi:hypothetical protein